MTPRLRLLLHLAFGGVGLAAVAFLVQSVGVEAVASNLRRAGGYLPLVVALEAGRIGTETASAYLLCAQLGRPVPPLRLARVQLIGYALAMTMPAGRATGEALKAAMLSPSLGAPRAAAVGATSQALALLSSAFIGLASALAAVRATGASPLSFAFGLFTAVSLAAFILFQLACRRRSVGGRLLRRFARFGQAASSFRDALAGVPFLPVLPAAVMALGRVVQTVEFGLLAHALGAPLGAVPALLAEGVNAVGGSVGDLVPGQLGATDGAFAFAAPALGISVADGVAMAVVAHLVQLFWTVVGATAPLWWRQPPVAHREGPASAAAPSEIAGPRAD